MQYTHVSFSDESSSNSGRYRSIGMVSGSRPDALALHKETARLLRDSDVEELKWRKIRTAKHRIAAEKVIDACASAVSQGRLWVDVLIWDSQDSRHAVPNPDPATSLQIMYFHLFKNVMSRRWPSDCVWRHIPDEQVGARWEKIESCLSATDSCQVNEPALGETPTPESFGASIKRLFKVAEITECRSQEMRLTQISDILAGMGAFSREWFAEYRAWKRNVGYDSTLFEATRHKEPPGQLEKFQVLSHFEARIYQLALPVAIDQTNGLRTLDPSTPVNFWLYQPQSRFDKTRGKGDNELAW